MAEEQNFSRMDRRDFLRVAGLVSAAGLIPGAGLTTPAEAQNDAGDLPPRQFSHPDRVRYDSRCLYVENKPFLMYSGEFHYSRCPKPLWPARFEKIKEAGFNTVQVYVMWNYHERAMPDSLDDFSKVDLTDLNDWLTMAAEFGLYVSMRPGPYVCAEWNTGGFPQWLLTKKPSGYKGEQYKGTWLRTNDPDFVAWSLHWYKAVCPVVAPHQITRKKPGEPGVILFQVENEYDFVWQVPDSAKRNYLRALVRQARADGIDVPLFINWGQSIIGSRDPELRQIFDAMDEYPRYNVQAAAKDAIKYAKLQTDAPLMVAELQGGWFENVKGAQSLRTNSDYYTANLGPAQINNLTLLCLQNGVTLMNYYMLFGGTNMDAWAAKDIATSYDYFAPIRECGGVGEKYLRVKALAAMIQKHGPALAQSTAVNTKAQTAQGDVQVAARQAPDGGYYLFVRTRLHDFTRKGAATVSINGGPTVNFNYELEAFGAKILYLPAGATSADQGQWLPEPQTLPARPVNLPGEVALNEVRTQADPLPTVWKPAPASLADLGDYIGGFSYYRFNAPGLLMVANKIQVDQLTAGGVTGLINKVLFAAKDGVSPAAFSLPNGAGPGANNLYLVYEDTGHPNGGPDMEKLYGISDINTFPLPAVLDPAIMISPLEYGGGPTGIALGWQNPEFDDSSWSKNALPQQTPASEPPALLSWHRMAFSLPATDAGVWVPWCVHLEASGNGFIFINGQNIGRYWQNGGQKDFFLPDCWLNTGPDGKNVIALCLRGVDKPAGVLSASIVPYTAYAEIRS